MGGTQPWRWEREVGDDWERVWTCCGGPYDERPNGHYIDCTAPFPLAEADQPHGGTTR